MKRLISVILAVALMSIFLLVPVEALYIYDDNGELVGTSVLTSSSYGRVYNLEVHDLTYSGTAYGRIYLYDSYGYPYAHDWDGHVPGVGGYSNSVVLNVGDSSITPNYRNISSRVKLKPYVYYNEYDD